MKKEISCGSITFNGDNVLLIKHNHGHIDFPKGHIEDGETFEETAVRETKEETNINVKIRNPKSYKITYSLKENIIKDVYFFIADYVSGIPKPQESEVSEAFWVNKEEVDDLITFDDMKKLWQQIKKDV